jgi:hypothetical protein
MDKIVNWADTPWRRAALILPALGTLFLAIRYPKGILPTALVAGTVIPPMMYASRERHEFFGVTYGTQLTIHIDPISDEEIIEHEMKAIEALKEVRRRRAEEERRKALLKDGDTTKLQTNN